jgi:hypothetical protein
MIRPISTLHARAYDVKWRITPLAKAEAAQRIGRCRWVLR